MPGGRRQRTGSVSLAIRKKQLTCADQISMDLWFGRKRRINYAGLEATCLCVKSLIFVTEPVYSLYTRTKYLDRSKSFNEIKISFSPV